MSDAPETDALPPSLRFLKWLVIVLTLTMIGGVITVVAVIVTRMPDAFREAEPALPETIDLPHGVLPRAVTVGTGWFIVVTDRDTILIFNADGTLRRKVRVD